MAKPRLIILVRHAQSEGNRNREIHQSIPDHRVKLTNEGWTQAHDAGRRLRNLLRPDDTIHFFTSPYRRTRETTEGILTTLTSDDPGPSPYRRANIKVYEEPRLREQDFGNFQPCGAEMERMWQERADYGHFFYRIPNGESAADAYDRVSGFNESLWRQFGEDDFASVCVLVTHGLMSRVFLMKWYHFSVEYFEDLRNVNHCEFLVMRKQDNGKFLLENNLRTWSELRRERALKEAKDAEAKGLTPNSHKDKDKEHAADKLDRVKSNQTPRRWGGCPNGCNHSRHYVKRRDDLELLRQKDNDYAVAALSPISPSDFPPNAHANNGNSNNAVATWRQRLSSAISSDEEEPEDHSGARAPPPEIQIVRDKTVPVEDPPSSPEIHHAQPTMKRAGHRPRLHVGRDGGGTYSGHASTAGSDTEASEDEHQRRHQHHHHHHHHIDSLNARIRIANAESLQNELEKAAIEGGNSESRHEYANRLGDAPPEASDADAEMDDLDRAEKEDRSIRGSVY